MKEEKEQKQDVKIAKVAKQMHITSELSYNYITLEHYRSLLHYLKYKMTRLK